MKVLSALFSAAMLSSFAAGHIDEPEFNHIQDRVYGHFDQLKERRGLKEEDVRNLIVGGSTPNPIGRYPYFTILDVELPSAPGEQAQFFFCGAALIHQDIVITTADCVDNFASIAVAVNFTTTTGPTGFEYFRFVTDLIIHPDYDPADNANDIAVLKLEVSVTQVAPIAIQQATQQTGVEITAMGFGATDAAATVFPTTLQAATLTTLARSSCRSAYGARYLGARMICAASTSGTPRDTCAGDAGGPVILAGATAADDTLVGLTSFGTGCADPLNPGVYTRLSFYSNGDESGGAFAEDGICDISAFSPIACPTRAPSSSPTVTGAPTGPTASPAPSISSAPSMQPTRKKTKFCFSGENTVETVDGSVRMDDLQLGDRIKSGDDNFEEIYSFGHYSDELESEYLQLFTEGNKQPLELSADHMVFLQNNVAVAASDVNVGDNLLLADGEISTVKSIKAITRKGMYAPFTDSGTVAVNGIKASSFVAFQGDGFQTPFSDHFAAHMSQTPQRILARLGFSCKSFTEEGVNSCLVLPMKMHQWFKSLPPFALVFLLTPFITLLFALYTVEQYPRTFLAIGALAFLYRKLVVRVTKVKQM